VAGALHEALPLTKQVGPRRLVLQWTPLLPGLGPSPARRRLSSLVVVAVIVVTLLATAVATGLVASRPHLPAPFGLARTGLVAFDADGDVGLIAPDGYRLRMLTSGPAVDWQPTFAPDGTRLAYWSGTDIAPGVPRDLIVVDISGQDPASRVVAHVSGLASWSIAWAPDSRRLAYSDAVDGVRHVFVVDTLIGGSSRLDPPGIEAWDPSFSPDGRTIAFLGGHFDPEKGVYLMGADGSDPRRLANSPSGATNFLTPTWSPNGDRIAVVIEMLAAAGDVWALPIDGSRASNLSNDPASDSEPTWAPDGGRIAWIRHTQGSGGAFQVVVADPGGGNPRVLPPIVQDMQPLWAPDATRILAQGQDLSTGNANAVLEIDVRTGDTITLSNRAPIGVSTWQRLAP
jgi:Tol biopolymer transport system component